MLPLPRLVGLVTNPPPEAPERFYGLLAGQAAPRNHPGRSGSTAGLPGAFLSTQWHEALAPTLPARPGVDLDGRWPIVRNKTEQDGQISRLPVRRGGVVKADAVRNAFVRIVRGLGHPEATCPT